MRISADVETTNRLCATLNMRGKGKLVRAQLSVGRKPAPIGTEGEIMLMICTKQDRNGSKYKLKNNIEQIFAKFISEGKATLRFIQPAIDLIISKADSIQLKGFLSIVRLGHQGGNLEKVSLSSLSPATTKSVENLKRRLVITNRRDYPITTGFPHGLDTLHVQHCNMKRIDSRMLQLRQLRVLNLSNNRLASLPEDWSTVSGLAELYLADNLLTDLPRAFCSDSPLCNSLTLLDISRNKLKIIRPWFCDLIALVTLKLNSNELVALPNGLGRLARLRYLYVPQNKLRVLPASFTQLRLDELDLFSNPFMEDGASTVINRLNEDTGLLELAARAIRNHRIHYTRDCLPGHLYEMLASAKKCLCGSPCFRSFVHYLSRLDLHRVTASVSGIDEMGRTHAPCEAFLCSRKCLQRYEKNPRATLWK